mmetsp:Transcript_28613/g.70549  ORF Transcript_28613/g.70549 Transcript_28613/m.70549 type:complete len:236 (-) Transcript_28613:3636-4343(-)
MPCPGRVAATMPANTALAAMMPNASTNTYTAASFTGSVRPHMGAPVAHMVATAAVRGAAPASSSMARTRAPRAGRLHAAYATAACVRLAAVTAGVMQRMMASTAPSLDPRSTTKDTIHASHTAVDAAAMRPRGRLRVTTITSAATAMCAMHTTLVTSNITASMALNQSPGEVPSHAHASVWGVYANPGHRADTFLHSPAGSAYLAAHHASHARSICSPVVAGTLSEEVRGMSACV